MIKDTAGHEQISSAECSNSWDEALASSSQQRHRQDPHLRSPALSQLSERIRSQPGLEELGSGAKNPSLHP